MKEKVKILNEDKLQPHDIDTEQAVLATFIRYNEKYNEFADIVDESCFFYDREKAIFRCIEGVLGEGSITDPNSLNNYAQSHNVGYELNRDHFVDIIQFYNTDTIRQDIMRLRDMAKRRRCWYLLQVSAQRALDFTVDVDQEMTDVMQNIGELQAGIGDDDISTFKSALDGVYQVCKENREGHTQSLKTGIKIFDEYHLLRQGTMTVVAAFTGVGKSAIALNIAMNVASQKNPVAYYSLEMGKVELAMRAISKAAKIPSSIIMNKPLTDKQSEDIHSVGEKYKNLPIYFDDKSTVAFDRTMRSIRRLVKTRGIKLAIIDYLQIYAQVSEDSEESLSYMARTAKNIAKELGIAIIILSQLNRDGLHPSLKMLRGSGQIAESADNVVLIDRPEAYPDNRVTKYEGEFSNESIIGTAKIILAKGRGVGTSSDLMQFDAKHVCFCERVEQSAEKYIEHEDILPF